MKERYLRLVSLTLFGIHLLWLNNICHLAGINLLWQDMWRTLSPFLLNIYSKWSLSCCFQSRMSLIWRCFWNCTIETILWNQVMYVGLDIKEFDMDHALGGSQCWLTVNSSLCRNLPKHTVVATLQVRHRSLFALFSYVNLSIPFLFVEDMGHCIDARFPDKIETGIGIIFLDSLNEVRGSQICFVYLLIRIIIIMCMLLLLLIQGVPVCRKSKNRNEYDTEGERCWLGTCSSWHWYLSTGQFPVLDRTNSGYVRSYTDHASPRLHLCGFLLA